MLQKNWFFYGWMICSLVAVMAITATRVQAERLESNSYIMQFSNLNTTSGTKSSASYTLTDTVGQTASGPYGTYGSTTFAGGGFQYIYQIQDFSFSLSKRSIRFWQLTPGSFSTENHTISITTRGNGGYTVYTYQQKPLTHADGVEIIPNTSCNSGCSIDTAGVWNNPAYPGFGYSVAGTDASADFINSTYFRPFADSSIGQNMQPIMSSNGVVTNSTTTVNYKVAVDQTQAAGMYYTGIIYVAVPAY